MAAKFRAALVLYEVLKGEAMCIGFHTNIGECILLTHIIVLIRVVHLDLFKLKFHLVECKATEHVKGNAVPEAKDFGLMSVKPFVC